MSSGKCKLKKPKISQQTYENGQNQEHGQHQMRTRVCLNRNSHKLSLGMQNGADSLVVSLKTKPPLNIRFSDCALVIYPKELKTYVYTETCTWIFIAALLIIAKTQKQLRCPSVCEWIDNWSTTRQWNVLNVLKGNESSDHEKTWRKLKCILLLSERNQSEKAI